MDDVAFWSELAAVSYLRFSVSTSFVVRFGD